MMIELLYGMVINDFKTSFWCEWVMIPVKAMISLFQPTLK